MKTVEKENKKLTKKDEAFVLWKQKDKNGKDYLTGHDLHNNKLVAFFNTNKSNPKEPDVRVYDTKEDGHYDKEVASLWENISKKDDKTRYLTGNTDEKEKLVAFYEKEENEKRPYIKAYFQD